MTVLLQLGCAVVFVWIASAGDCPVSNCKEEDSFLQLSSNSTLHAKHTEQSGGENALGPAFVAKFLPGQFTCMKPDMNTCAPKCILCELESTVGMFYKQECFCKEGDAIDEEPKTYICDPQCGGALCDTEGFMCKAKGPNCQNWLDCDTPESFVQEKVSLRATLNHQKRNTERLTVERIGQARSLLGVSSQMSAKGLKAEAGRFICEAGALPPPMRDPATQKDVARGYVVLDKNTCKGEVFATTCYCWDSYDHLKGKNPGTSEFTCDAKCRWGPCDGKTCGMQPPAPPAKPMPSGAGISSRRHVDYAMEPVDIPVMTGPRR